MEKYKRKSVFENLMKYDTLANKDDYIELTEWNNGEGFDVDVNGKTNFPLTYGQYKAIRKLLKELSK